MRSIGGLTDLISPVGISEFREGYWEKNFLRVERNDPQYFDPLLQIGDVNDFLARRDIQYPMIELVKAGKVIPTSKYTKVGKAGGGRTINNDRLFHYFSEGATIVFQDLGRSFPVLDELTTSLEAELWAKSWVNAYLTPTGSRGFRPHYDTHDVFIVQIFGSKEWKIYDHPVLQAHKEQPYDRESLAKEEPTAEFTLKAGDLLYIPRGLVHVADAEQETSMHLTVGVSTYKWMDLFREGTKGLANSLSMRSSVGGEFYQGLDEEKIGELMTQFKEGLTGEGYETLKDLLFKIQVQSSKNRLLDTIKLPGLSMVSRLQVRKALRHRIKPTAEGIDLLFYEKNLTFHSDADLALKWISENGQAPFQVYQLPGNYTSEAKENICYRLVKEGFLTFSD